MIGYALYAVWARTTSPFTRNSIRRLKEQHFLDPTIEEVLSLGLSCASHSIRMLDSLCFPFG